MAEDRIMVSRKYEKVNTNFDKMVLRMDRRNQKKKRDTKADAKAQELLEDDRFKNMFVSKDFEIDEKSEAYKLNNPS